MKKLYTVYDRKSKAFFSPFTSENDDTAKRMLASSVNSSGTMISQYPEDYDLFMIGSFSETTGCVTGVTPAEFVCRLDSLRVSAPVVSAEVTNG